MKRSVDMCPTLNERKSVVVETANRYQKVRPLHWHLESWFDGKILDIFRFTM